MIFKKIKKLIFHPVQFIADSYWFKTPPFSNFPNDTNLFVVSTFAQLNQVHSFIKFRKLNNNIIVILYTLKNLKMPRLVKSSVDHKLFDTIYLYELPVKPSKLSLKYFVYISRGYRRLLNDINPKNIFVMSFSGHYALLLAIAKKKKTTTHLIEEGTATYAPLLDSFTPNISKIERFFLKNHLNNKGYYNNFDHLHVTYPELARNIFTGRQISRFFAHAAGMSMTKDVLDIQHAYRIGTQDYIYVSQRFPVQDDLYYHIIIDILSNLSLQLNCTIFIKLHPKEMENKDIMQVFLDKTESNPNLIAINTPPFLIDPLIYLTQPKGIIGITSTSLVYASLLNPNIQTISIAAIVLDILRHQYNQNCPMMEEHLEIIKYFSSVHIIPNMDALTNYQSPKVSAIEMQSLLASAKKAYQQKNWYHAIFYWQLGTKGDIKQLDTTALWYYMALYKVKQYYKMDSNEIEYIDSSFHLFNEKDKLYWNDIKIYFEQSF